MSTFDRLSARQQRHMLALAALAARAKQGVPDVQPEPPEFASDEHERFYRSEARELVASGWMGAGKSRVLCQKAVDLALAYPGAELALFRKTGTSLPATTERMLLQEVLDPGLIRARNRGEHWIDVGRRGQRTSRIWLLGLDPDPVTGVPSKVGSLNLDWAGVDEGVELTLGDWIMLMGRLRNTTIPYQQLAAVTNPAHPTHWLKRRFAAPSESGEWITIKTNRFLSDDFLQSLARLGDSVDAKRLGQGLWVAAEGTIWVVPEDQVRPPEQAVWRRVVAGIDWGFTHAFACEVVGQSGSGRLAVIDELYRSRHTIDEIIPALQYLRDLHHIETFYADPSEPGYISQCQRAGLPVVRAINDVRPGIGVVSTAIAQGLTIAPSCTGLLGELPGYAWARDRSGSAREEPDKQDDDACDALRYAIVGVTGALDTNPWAQLIGQRVGAVA